MSKYVEVYGTFTFANLNLAFDIKLTLKVSLTAAFLLPSITTLN